MKLSPKIDMILALVQNQALNWSTALSEFVDNSFGPDAGNASDINIIIGKDAIQIIDDGEGFRDINALYQLGSGTSRESSRDIGLYGIGSKQAQLWIGARCTIDTVRETRRHRHSILWPIIWRANGPELKAGADWPDSYEGKGGPAAKGAGTHILLDRLHPGKPSCRVPNLAQSLGLTYAPALRAGKTLTIIDERKALSRITSVVPDEPPQLTHSQTFRGAIHDMPYELFVGCQENYESRYNALFISWGHRVIKPERNPFERPLPSRFYGRLHLADEWKACLSANKLDVATHKEELLEDVYQQCKQLLEDYDWYERELRLEIFMGNLSTHMGLVLKVIANSKDGDFAGGEVVHTDHPVNPGPDEAPHKPEKGGDKQAEPVQQPMLPIRIVYESLGKDADDVVSEGAGFLIRLNNDIPYISAALQYPFNTSAIWGLASSALAAHLVHSQHALARKYADMAAVFQESRLLGELLRQMPLEKAIANPQQAATE